MAIARPSSVPKPSLRFATALAPVMVALSVLLECSLCVAPSLSIHGRSCASALAFLGEWNAPNPD
jgi:hypothetical protein